MPDIDPAATFEVHRRRLIGLAYRMLGSMAEAEDAVQEAYLRWHGAARDGIENVRAFLMTTTARICIDQLRSALARREAYVGPWLPEPVLDTAALAPDVQTELAEDLSIALMLTLDRLSPLERAAFLLHDVFDLSFAEVAAALDRSVEACRQLAARARAHVRQSRPRGVSGPDPRHAALLAAFVEATARGDLGALTRMLAEDARFVGDGGGKAAAALKVVEGADRVSRLLIGGARKTPLTEAQTLHYVLINGLPGLLVQGPDGPIQTVALEIEDGRIRAIYAVRNPDKLARLSPPATTAPSGPASSAPPRQA